ncbi:MAG: methionine--tRNA ligase, partial [Candidatus Omnitrophica bacterium]|nr:methionine--tRNA ligase [Candidatus Omnitrophota bacterium]
ASPHIGHAYTNIIIDCMARYKRIQGQYPFFLTGTDEHGEKIKKTAEEKGEDVNVFVDSVVENFKNLWKSLNISYDCFVRTTDTSHHQAVKAVITILSEKGDIYKEKYKGYYCLPCESFWTASQVEETKVCPDCHRQVSILEEDNYFFKLSKYQEWLIDYLKNNPDFVKPRTRYNEVLSFLANNTLEDLCISRPKKRLSWGIDFPLDNDYVVYVWFDALINYISAVGFSVDKEKFKTLWPADIHFMAKDILRHHAVYWPIMLYALGLDLPKTVFAHGWWNFQGEKMSKSRGNIVNPLDLIQQIPVDALRYFLLREIPVGADGNFSWKAIVSRVNSDLANDLGKLVYRTLNMTEKYFQGNISCSAKAVPSSFSPAIEEIETKYNLLMDNGEFSQALESVFRFISVMNKFIEETKPWVLNREQKKQELEDFLYSLLEGIRITAIYLYPFIPETSLSIFRQIGFAVLSGAELGLLSKAHWSEQRQYKITKESPLFPRIDVD